MIDRSSYEVYMIDYLDGKLDAVAVSELLLFIEQHPDLARELELLSIPAEAADLTSAPDLSALKKPLYAEVKVQYAHTLIAAMEGDLEPAQREQLDRAFVIYPELKQDAALFEQTRLQPEMHVVFDNKRTLKRSIPLFRIQFNDAWKAAAVLVLFALILFWNNIPEQQLAQVQPANTPVPVTQQQKHVTQQAPAQPGEQTATQPSIKEHHAPVAEKKTVQKETVMSVAAGSIPFHELQQQPLEPVATTTEQLQAAKLAPAVQQQLAYQDRPVATDEFKELPELISERLKRSVLVEQNKPDSARKGVALADVGLLFVKLYNHTTGDDAKVTRKYDASGKVIGFGIVANNFQFSTGK